MSAGGCNSLGCRFPDCRPWEIRLFWRVSEGNWPERAHCHWSKFVYLDTALNSYVFTRIHIIFMTFHKILMTFLYHQNPSREAAYSGQGIICQLLLFLKSWCKNFYPSSVFPLGQTVSHIGWSMKVTLPHFLPVQVLLFQDFCLPQKHQLRYKIAEWVPALVWKVLGSSFVLWCISEI